MSHDILGSYQNDSRGTFAADYCYCFFKYDYMVNEKCGSSTTKVTRSNLNDFQNCLEPEIILGISLPYHVTLTAHDLLAPGTDNLSPWVVELCY